MTKEKWSALTDEQKNDFMRNAFRVMGIGDTFDYSRCRKLYERMKDDDRLMGFGEFKQPCIVLELVDPIMAHLLMSWMYTTIDIQTGEPNLGGCSVPIFGYKIIELFPDKGSLMKFSDTERSVLREAMRIIREKTEGDE